MCKCAIGNFWRQPQPCGIEVLEEADHPLPAEGELLHGEVKRGERSADREIPREKPIKLVPVHGEMTDTAILPHIFLINANTDKVRHDLRKPVIVVPFHPHHFDFAFGIRKFADISKETPVFFFQTPEVKVRENIAQQDEPIE